MSKLTESFREVGIYNAYSYAGEGQVFIDYTPIDRGRGGHGSHWQVHRPGFKTDPEGPWYNYGSKTFNVSLFAL